MFALYKMLYKQATKYTYNVIS